MRLQLFKKPRNRVRKSSSTLTMGMHATRMVMDCTVLDMAVPDMASAYSQRIPFQP